MSTHQVKESYLTVTDQVYTTKLSVEIVIKKAKQESTMEKQQGGFGTGTEIMNKHYRVKIRPMQ